jgi:rod shape-determining protein MreD
LLAVVVGILHAALAPVIVVGGVKPNLVLIAVVLVATLVGFMPGIVWAFVAGLTANLLVGDALGSVPLLMLVVAAIAAGGARLLGRIVWIYPIVAVFVGSMVADVGTLTVTQLVDDAPILAGIPTELIVGAAFLNAALATVALYPARLAARRFVSDEQASW